MNAKISRLPQWCIDIIANPPRSGEGFHNWLFRAARALWKCDRYKTDIVAILESAAATCGRYVPQREIENAVRNSQASAFQPANLQRRAWPSVNTEQREAITANGFGLVDLWEISPIRFEDGNRIRKKSSMFCFPVIRGFVSAQLIAISRPGDVKNCAVS
jgi:hypothetical protein